MQPGLWDAPAVVRAHGLRDAHVYPLVSPDVGQVRRSYRVPAARAWGFPRLELRSGNCWPVLSFDVDGGAAVDRLAAAILGADLREPSFVTFRVASGNAHAHYALASPVHRTDRARLAPLAYFSRIGEYYHAALLADPAYRGVLTLNPVWDGGEYRTVWLHKRPYTLDELAEVIPRGWRRPRVAQTGAGRNVDTFRWAVKEAHRPRWGRTIAAACVRDVPEWVEHVDRHQALEYGPYRLPASEVRTIARSAAGYSLRQYSDRRFQAIQTYRGRRSGKARREAAADRDRRIIDLRAEGWTQARIAADVGLTQARVAQVLARGIISEP